MNVDSLLHYIDEDGSQKVICRDYLPRVLSAETLTDLIRLYKAEPSWALSVHYPAYEIMKEMFDNAECRRNGVFVDQDLDKICDDQVYVFNKCRGKIKVIFNPNKACFPILYMGLGCEIDVHVDGTYSEINVYDGGKLNITTSNKGKVVVYKYCGVEISFTDPTRVIIRDKR